MRTLQFTSGSPFGRAIRIILDELELDYERQEESTAQAFDQRAAAAPTLQIPTFWDDKVRLWESGLIAEYLLRSYPNRPIAETPLAESAWRDCEEWRDKLVFSTVQTMGTAITTVSQLTWTGVTVDSNAHLKRSATRVFSLLEWLEGQLLDASSGFFPNRLSIQDIFLTCHLRFLENRPLGIDLDCKAYPKLFALLTRLDERKSFKGNPIWWWEPGITGYRNDGTPVWETG